MKKSGKYQGKKQNLRNPIFSFVLIFHFYFLCIFFVIYLWVYIYMFYEQSVLGALYFILFLLRITLNKNPFQFSAYYRKRDEIYMLKSNWSWLPDRLNWIDFCIYLQINRLESLIDKNLRYIILPTISFFFLSYWSKLTE